MRDNYTGDVGDFGKYGLLNEFLNQAENKMRLGINWYYNDCEEIPKGDGGHIAYLDISEVKNSRYRSCSPEMYDKLRLVVFQNRRKISEIENSEILPKETLFYSIPIPHFGTTSNERIRSRQLWFGESLSVLEPADIIFLDPDNGICLDTDAKGKLNGIKYVFTDEIEAYCKSGKSLIVYNHRDRKPRGEYEMKILSCRQYVRSHSDLKVLRFKRVQVRDFIFLIQDHHRELMDRTIKRLTNSQFRFKIVL